MPRGREVFIMHRIRGRVRMSVEALRRDPTLAERLVRRVREIPCVVDARANAWAASLVIEHDDGITLPDLMMFLGEIPELSECARLGREDPPPAEPRREAHEPSHPAQATGILLRTAARINEASRAAAPPGVDLKILVPGALFGYGLFRVMSGGSGSRLHWITLCKYGFDLFAVLNQGAIRSFIEAHSGIDGPARDNGTPA